MYLGFLVNAGGSPEGTHWVVTLGAMLLSLYGSWVTAGGLDAARCCIGGSAFTHPSTFRIAKALYLAARDGTAARRAAYPDISYLTAIAGVMVEQSFVYLYGFLASFLMGLPATILIIPTASLMGAAASIVRLGIRHALLQGAAGGTAMHLQRLIFMGLFFITSPLLYSYGRWRFMASLHIITEGRSAILFLIDLFWAPPQQQQQQPEPEPAAIGHQQPQPAAIGHQQQQQPEPAAIGHQQPQPQPAAIGHQQQQQPQPAANAHQQQRHPATRGRQRG